MLSEKANLMTLDYYDFFYIEIPNRLSIAMIVKS